MWIRVTRNNNEEGQAEVKIEKKVPEYPQVQDGTWTDQESDQPMDDFQVPRPGQGQGAFLG